MNFKLEVGASEFRDQFDSNKELYISLAVLLGAALLFIMLILPSILDFPRKFAERSEEVEKLNKIKEAQQIIESADDNLLDEEVEIATKALPSERNFEIILGAISEAAARSGSRVINYSYNDRSRPGIQKTKTSSELVFDIGVLGGVEDAAKFADEILKTYPVSAIKAITFEDGFSEVQVAFFYLPFTKVQSQEVALAREKSSAEQKTYEEISNWNSYSIEQIFLDQISSTAAELVN